MLSFALILFIEKIAASEHHHHGEDGIDHNPSKLLIDGIALKSNLRKSMISTSSVKNTEDYN